MSGSHLERGSYQSGPCLELAGVLFQGRLVVAEYHDLFEVHIHEGTDRAEHFVLVHVTEFVAVEPGGLAAINIKKLNPSLAVEPLPLIIDPCDNNSVSPGVPR